MTGNAQTQSSLTDYPQAKLGLIYTLSAFTWWGLVPIYLKALGHVSPWVILCHRVVWSVPFLAVMVTVARDWPRVLAAWRDRKTALVLCSTAVLLGGNWFLFIYSVSSGQVLAASLGYYITPLINVVLGMIFLRERLTKWQAAAILLAGAGAVNLALSVGRAPWISLGMAFSFGLYGLLRKQARISPAGGLFTENVIMLPVALGWLIQLNLNAQGAFTQSWTTAGLLIAAGAITSLPLVWFAAGVKRLPLTVVGLCQYLAPTIYFFMGVFLYGEPFSAGHMVTFALIWLGLGLYVWDSWKRSG